MQQAGKIVIVTAPSGSGKTSITRHLLGRFPELDFSVSATTRPPRGNEQHGREYYFLSIDEFRQKIAGGAFLEWEMVYEGRYYGTLRSEIDRMWRSGRVPVLDIDVHGAIHVMELYPGRCLSMFIKAPSLEALRSRLENRGTETPESIAMRLGKAEYEMSFQHYFDAVIINDNLSVAQAEAEQLVGAFLQE